MIKDRYLIQMIKESPKDICRLQPAYWLNTDEASLTEFRRQGRHFNRSRSGTSVGRNGISSEEMGTETRLELGMFPGLKSEEGHGENLVEAPSGLLLVPGRQQPGLLTAERSSLTGLGLSTTHLYAYWSSSPTCPQRPGMGGWGESAMAADAGQRAYKDNQGGGEWG